jgi:hypothetical protein
VIFVPACVHIHSSLVVISFSLCPPRLLPTLLNCKLWRTGSGICRNVVEKMLQLSLTLPLSTNSILHQIAPQVWPGVPRALSLHTLSSAVPDCPSFVTHSPSAHPVISNSSPSCVKFSQLLGLPSYMFSSLENLAHCQGLPQVPTLPATSEKSVLVVVVLSFFSLYRPAPL